MKIDAFILCYNESKMIEHTLNYYSNFCNEITIIDNQSTDNSLEIVKEKFPNVIVKELNTEGEYREDVQIYIRNNCWKQSDADYVIVIDMDEFLYDENLIEKLKKLHERRIAIPIVSGYNMVSNTFPENYKLPIVEQIKKGYRDRTFDKSIIFSPKLVNDINFGPGSHSCNPDFKEKNYVDEIIDFKLLHYKYLSHEYLYEKHKSYAQRMSEANRKYKFGFEYELGKEHIDKAFIKLNKHLYSVVK